MPVGILEKVVNFLTPTVMSRIVSGALYRTACLDMYAHRMLVVPATDLAPAHVNCARVIFLNTANAVLDLELMAQKGGCALLADSLVYYGTEGTPITD